MIKFYNPFKPHIVEDGFGKFWIRALSIVGWTYYNKDDKKFWFVKGYADCFQTFLRASDELYNARENHKRKAKRDKVVS